MEIDLIDNVPCSHCEQLVPCEHNPETSSKNFSSTNFQSLILFLPFSPKDETRVCQGRQNPVLSRTSKTGRIVVCVYGGGGSRIKRRELRDKRSREHQRKGLRYWERAREGRGDWPNRLSHPSPENPPLISVSNRKYLILVLRGLRRHDYTLPASPARRGGIWPIRPPRWGWCVA